jgi:hypothetical protein
MNPAKNWYAYTTTSGSINLIEGDKMPVKPEDRCVTIRMQDSERQVLKDGIVVWSVDVRSDDYAYSHAEKEANRIRKILKDGYQADLQAAKASSVPIQDQERVLRLIYRDNKHKINASYGEFISEGLKTDHIYGPFTVEYEIEFQCRPYDTQDWQSTNEHYCLTVGSSNPCAEKRKIAILYDDTPEKEESQDPPPP